MKLHSDVILKTRVLQRSLHYSDFGGCVQFAIRIGKRARGWPRCGGVRVTVCLCASPAPRVSRGGEGLPSLA